MDIEIGAYWTEGHQQNGFRNRAKCLSNKERAALMGGPARPRCGWGTRRPLRRNSAKLYPKRKACSAQPPALDNGRTCAAWPLWPGCNCGKDNGVGGSAPSFPRANSYYVRAPDV